MYHARHIFFNLTVLSNKGLFTAFPKKAGLRSAIVLTSPERKSCLLVPRQSINIPVPETKAASLPDLSDPTSLSTSIESQPVKCSSLNSIPPEKYEEIKLELMFA